MVYFMGQDIAVYITTENTVTAGGVDGYVTVTAAGVTTNQSGAHTDTTFAGPLSGNIGFFDGDDLGVPKTQNITGLDVSIGAMDEDITYF